MQNICSFAKNIYKNPNINLFTFIVHSFGLLNRHMSQFSKTKKKKYIQNSIPKHLLLYLFLATHIVLEFAIDKKIYYFELKFSIDSKRLHNCIILLNKLKECYNLFSTSSFCTKCLSCMPQNVLSVIFSGRVSLVLLINEPV